MFREIIISIGVVSSDGVSEKLIDKKLVDSISKLWVFVIFIFSESGESFYFLEDIGLIEKSLDQVKPRSSVNCLFFDFENYIMLLEEVFRGVNLVQS